MLKQDAAGEIPSEIMRWKGLAERLPGEFAGDVRVLAPPAAQAEHAGLEAGGESESWAEFIRNLGDVSLQGKTVALFGLGDQRGYPDNFASGLRPLYDALRARGATMIGSWPNEGYEFSASSALEGERFVGLVLDQDNQFDETETRLATWLEEIKPHLL